MLRQILISSFVLLALSRCSLAQYQEFYYDERMEGQSPFVEEPAGLEDPSFEFPLAERPSQDKIYATKDFINIDLDAVQSLTRTWIGTEDEERVLGRKFMRFNGTGGFANWFPIRPLYEIPGIPSAGPSLGHYVTVRARQDGPFEAIFGINYFDANWNLIQKNSALISGAEAGVSRGDGDLLKKYTIPVRVPFGAAFGQVWIAAPYEDGTTTFDFLNVFTEIRFEPNASFNPNANLLRNSSRFLGNFDYYKTGYEFWNVVPGSEPGVKVDYWMPELGEKSLLLGQPGRITNLYQVFDVQANQPYAIRFITDPRPGLSAPNALPHARGWFGVDFFNSAAQRIDQVVFDISQGESILEATYNPTANADFAIAWLYVEPLFRDEVLPIYEVDVHVPYAEVTATAAKTAAVASSAATGTTKKPATTSKSAKRFVPRSPVTPAMARAAQKSLQASSVKGKTTPK